LILAPSSVSAVGSPRQPAHARQTREVNDSIAGD
jgi:hypothetical protein